MKYAQLLCDGSEIKFRTSGNVVHTALNSTSPEDALTLELPVVLPQSAGEVPVVELFLK